MLLAKALISRPALLFLDEPTASLDPDTADRVRGWLQRFQRTEGASLLHASHDMGEVERLADEVLMMKAGSIVDRGSPEALLARYGRRPRGGIPGDRSRPGRQVTREFGLSLRRVRSVLKRHIYLFTSSLPRLLDLVYLPTVQMVLWG